VHLDTSVTDSFLATGSLPASWLLAVAAGDDGPPVPAVAPDPGAGPGIRAALAEVRGALDPFRPARPEVWDAVLPGWADALAEARVALVVGWPAPYDAGVRTDPEGRSVIVLDLARLQASAEPGGVVGAAQGLLDHELAHVVLAGLDPLPPGAAYEDRLDHLTWDEGLAHFLGMGTHRLVAPGDPDREDRRLDALAALSLALEATTPDEQETWLRTADAAHVFWDKFACVAGLLACVDAEHADGPAGVRALVDAGWRGSARRMLAGDAMLSRA
jgi:hypothetical protein